jgi:hypothetical protein
MITKLSYPLKIYIEQHIGEIEQNRIYNSIVSCPWNILNEYIEVLKMIDIPIDFEWTTIKLFQFVSSMFPEGYCEETDYIDNAQVHHFKLPLQDVNYTKLQKMLTDACPNCLLIHVEHMYASRVTTIEVKVFNN